MLNIATDDETARAVVEVAGAESLSRRRHCGRLLTCLCVLKLKAGEVIGDAALVMEWRSGWLTRLLPTYSIDRQRIG